MPKNLEPKILELEYVFNNFKEGGSLYKILNRELGKYHSHR